MRMRGFLLVVVVAVGCVLSCQAATELQGIDDMTPSSPAGAGGAGATTCSMCWDGACAWQVSDCTADPDCARWITCARGCPAGDDGNPSQSCMNACPAITSSTGMHLRDALQACLQRTGGCCDGDDLGDGGQEYVDGAPTGVIDGDDEPEPGSDSCGDDSCKACLSAAARDIDSCASPFPGCDSASNECMTAAGVGGGPASGHGDCVNFMLAFAGCAADPLFTAHDVADCVWVVPADYVDNTLDVIRCGALLCGVCSSPDLQGCLACQIESCRDAMAALLGDADAQGLYWCLRKCGASDDPALCRSECAGAYPAGVPVLTVLNQCTTSACSGKCGS